jgi:flagellar basal-body rod modification protein FlgD
MFNAGVGAAPTFANQPNNKVVQNPDPANPVVTSGDSTSDGQQFMQLIIAQLQNQDPMNPMDNSQFTQQLATVNSLQQLISMNQLMQQSMGASQISQATNLIGSYVVGLDANGNSISGQVDHVELVSGTPALNVNGQLLLMSQVQAIGVAPLTPTTNPGGATTGNGGTGS